MVFPLYLFLERSQRSGTAAGETQQLRETRQYSRRKIPGSWALNDGRFLDYDTLTASSHILIALQGDFLCVFYDQGFQYLFPTSGLDYKILISLTGKKFFFPVVSWNVTNKCNMFYYLLSVRAPWRKASQNGTRTPWTRRTRKKRERRKRTAGTTGENPQTGGRGAPTTRRGRSTQKKRTKGSWTESEGGGCRCRWSWRGKLEEAISLPRSVLKRGRYIDYRLWRRRIVNRNGKGKRSARWASRARTAFPLQPFNSRLS